MTNEEARNIVTNFGNSLILNAGHPDWDLQTAIRQLRQMAELLARPANYSPSSGSQVKGVFVEQRI